MIKKIVSLSLMVCLALAGKVSAQDYKATVFGIKSDGITNNTASIQRAIDYISEKGGGRLVFYVGRYLTGSIELKSNVTIRIASGAVLVASPSVYEYKGGKQPALIYAKGQENIALEGVGVLEGNGTQVAANVTEQVAKGHIKDAAELMPALIAFENCKQASVKELTLQNSATTAQVYADCEGLNVSKVNVFNKENDEAAMSVSGCKKLTVTDCYFDTKETLVTANMSASDAVFKGNRTPAGKEVSFK